MVSPPSRRARTETNPFPIETVIEAWDLHAADDVAVAVALVGETPAQHQAIEPAPQVDLGDEIPL